MSRYRRLNQKQQFELHAWLQKSGRNIKGRTAADLASEASVVMQMDIAPSSVQTICENAGLPLPMKRDRTSPEPDALPAGSVLGLTVMAQQFRLLLETLQADGVGVEQFDQIALQLIINRDWQTLNDHHHTMKKRQREQSNGTEQDSQPARTERTLL
jgi:hypothetical protein